MKYIFSVLIFLSFTYGVACAGELSGRIIKGDGSPLAGSDMSIDNVAVKTNEFGGYRVTLKDGERELNVKINNVSYTSEKVNIFSPKVKQNWKVDSGNNKLIKIR